MGFYLETSSGNQIYVSNNYLKGKLIDYSGATEVSSSATKEEAAAEKNFLQRIGIPIITLSSKSCAQAIVNNITPDNIEDLSAVLSLDKIHIITVAYLLRAGIMTQNDLLDFLHADSVYTRDAMLIRFLESDDPSVDIFAGLTYALSNLPRNANNTNKTETRISSVKKNDIPNTIGRYSKFTGEYFKYGKLLSGVATINGLKAKNILDEYVPLMNQPSFSAILTRIIDTKMTDTPDWVKWILKGAIHIILGLDDLVSFLGGWSISGKILQLVSEVLGQARVTISTADVYNEFIKLAAIECAKDKFNNREKNKKYEINKNFLTETFKDAYANVVMRAMNNINEFWKGMCSVAENQGYNYLYYSVIKVNFRMWRNLYDNDYSDNDTSKFYIDNKVSDSLISYRKLYNANNNNSSIFTEDALSRADILGLLRENRRLNITTGGISDAYNLVSKAASNFISYTNSASNRMSLDYDIERDVGNIDDAIVMLSDDAPISNSKYHLISNIGTSGFNKVVNAFIADVNNDVELGNPKLSDFTDDDDIVKYLKNVKQRVAKTAFFTTNADVQSSPLLLMAYEVVNNYLDFLIAGNTIYSDSDSIKGQDIQNLYANNLPTLKGDGNFDDLIFIPAISDEMFIFYRLIYIIRESYMMVPEILYNNEYANNLYLTMCQGQQ